MTKKEFERRLWMLRSLESMGINDETAESLRRISMQLSRWSERECNGEVEVDDDGKAYGTNAAYTTGTIRRWSVPNREAGALRRLAKIAEAFPALWFYHQPDPRGAALYVGRKESLPQGSRIDSVYSSFGIAIY